MAQGYNVTEGGQVKATMAFAVSAEEAAAFADVGLTRPNEIGDYLVSLAAGKLGPKFVSHATKDQNLTAYSEQNRGARLESSMARLVEQAKRAGVDINALIASATK